VMDKLEFLAKMLSDGKITQEQYDTTVTAETKKQSAKDKAKTDKTKLSKAELIAIIDDLT